MGGLFNAAGRNRISITDFSISIQTCWIGWIVLCSSLWKFAALSFRFFYSLGLQPSMVLLRFEFHLPTQQLDFDIREFNL
jgi:hypothetical protein